jgi:glycosyltransferase involved in cell wall biosynthesis
MAHTLGLTDRVSFTGRSPEHAMQIVSKADLVILPSRFDGFGLCIVEAMLGGRPVIVSEAAGVAGHVKKANGGWLTEPDTNSISEAILEALENRENWNEMGIQNKKYVLENLTWDQIASMTLEAYCSVFGSPV